jgi:hypothetical protein
MNQDNHVEEGFKRHNLLGEFHEDYGKPLPTILGFLNTSLPHNVYQSTTFKVNINHEYNIHFHLVVKGVNHHNMYNVKQ